MKRIVSAIFAVVMMLIPLAGRATPPTFSQGFTSNSTSNLNAGVGINGSINVAVLANPSAPTVTVNTTGSSSHTYYIVGHDGAGTCGSGNEGVSAVSSGTTAANSSSPVNNTITLPSTTGYVYYDVLKDATNTSLATCIAAGSSVNDTGQATAAYTAPTRNSTGDIRGNVTYNATPTLTNVAGTSVTVNSSGSNRDFFYQLTGAQTPGATITFTLDNPCELSQKDLRIRIAQDATNHNYVVDFEPSANILWQNSVGGAASPLITGANARTDYGFYCDAISGNWVNDNYQASTVQPQPSGAGGSGVASPTAHDVMIAEGSSPFNLLSLPSTDIIIGQGASADPQAFAVSGDATLSAAGALTVTKSNGQALPTIIAHSGPVDINTTSSETTIFSGTIPANYLGTKNCVYVTLDGDTLYNNANTDTLTLKLVKDAPPSATIFATTGAQTLAATSASRRSINAQLGFCNQNTSGSGATQSGFARMLWNAVQSMGNLSAKSVSEAVAVNVYVTATWSVSSANDDLNITGGTMEVK